MLNTGYKSAFVRAVERSKHLGVSPRNLRDNYLSKDQYFTHKDLNSFKELKNNLWQVAKSGFQATLDNDPSINLHQDRQRYKSWKDPIDLKGQCLMASLIMRKKLDEYFSTDTYLTIGYLQSLRTGKYYYEKYFLGKNDDQMLGWIPEVHNRGGSPVHVWLTMPTLEIVDMTHQATMAYVKKEPFNVDGIILDDFPDNFEFEYCPMLVLDEGVFYKK